MIRIATALTLFLAVVAPAVAGSAREDLEAFAHNLDVLEGRFEQRVYDPNGQLDDSSSGTLALRAPRQFRWQVVEPFPQLIVADGDNVWIFDEDLAQVTVRAQSIEEAQSPLTVLTDLGQLDRDYEAGELPDAEGLRWLRLTPRADEAPFVHCDLGFGPEGLSQMVLYDRLGQRNALHFSGWRRNPALDPALFRFVPPEGVDVVGEAVENADVFPIDG